MTVYLSLHSFLGRKMSGLLYQNDLFVCVCVCVCKCVYVTPYQRLNHLNEFYTNLKGIYVIT
jgi:hypothetical protein